MSVFKNKIAQATVEFTFTVIATMFLAYGMVQIFRWTGMDLAQRSIDQSNAMNVDLNGPPNKGNPIGQLNRTIAEDIQPVSAVYRNSVTDGSSAQ